MEILRLLYKREIGRKINELIGEQISEALLPRRNRFSNPISLVVRL